MDFKYFKVAAADISILYVEDNRVVREIFINYLKKIFNKVDKAVDGIEGLELYRKKKYDIVITDIDMPNMNGLEMSKKIKELEEEQHIIIVSAYNKLESYTEAIKIGVDGYILKPVEFDQVNQLLYKTVNLINSYKFKEAYKNSLKNMLDNKTEEMKKQFITDRLTGLNNRVYLDRQLNNSKSKTLIQLNINNFNILNNSFGFAFSDRVLITVGNLLKKFENEDFQLFRLQSDVFVFLSYTKNIEEALILANEIKNRFKYPIKVRRINLHIDFTMGIDFDSNRDLLKSTNLKIHELRETNKSQIGVYEENSDYELMQLENLNMIDKIRKINLEEDILLHFQPIKNIKTDVIDKYEVLARLKGNKGEIIMPNNFLKPISLAGLNSEFTKIIIDKSFRYFKNKDFSFSINITEDDLKEDYLQEYLLQKCEEYSINTNRVILEILETLSITDNQKIIDTLISIKKRGFKLAIDDFGSENSNFSRLLELDIDFIKIDGSFIKSVDNNKNSMEIVKAIVSFSHNIGYEVIAEYVYNEKTYNKLKEIEVDFAQGYHIGKSAYDVLK